MAGLPLVWRKTAISGVARFRLAAIVSISADGVMRLSTIRAP